MNKMQTLLSVYLVALPIALLAQAPDALRLGTYPDGWPTHYGDHSGRRYSPLTQINATNVKTLSLAWIHRVTAQEGDNVGGEYRTGDPYYWGGPQANVTIKATPLMVDGILYFAAPDHAYAIDARSGRTLWHYFWRTRGGIHIACSTSPTPTSGLRAMAAAEAVARATSRPSTTEPARSAGDTR